jgi:hypothetical protein
VVVVQGAKVYFSLNFSMTFINEKKDQIDKISSTKLRLHKCFS